MSRALGSHFDLARWRFFIPASSRDQSTYIRKEIVEEVVAALESKLAPPFRRSRHATTWKVKTAGPNGETTNSFVKQLDPARGLVARAKAKSRARRCEHVVRISEDLSRLGFGVPKVLLIGENSATGNEVIVTSEAPGFMLTRWMNPAYHIDLKLRRAILHKLGTEIARLHLNGYIHGDLTPYNIFATGDHPIAVTFIDHEGTERTSRVSIGVGRNRMRNLVQLGHFDIPGVSRTDNLRVFVSYATTVGLFDRARRQLLRRVTRMIEQRRERDVAIRRRTIQAATMTEERAARG